MKYFILYNGNEIGPMTKEEMMAYDIDDNTQVRTDMSQRWAPLMNYPELKQMLYVMGKTPGASSMENRRLVCGILSILIGGLGIQYFIIGKTTAGILNIVISLCTCGLWSIVNLIQGIMMLCMTDQEFNRKYVDTPATFPIF